MYRSMKTAPDKGNNAKTEVTTRNSKLFSQLIFKSKIPLQPHFIGVGDHKLKNDFKSLEYHQRVWKHNTRHSLVSLRPWKSMTKRDINNGETLSQHSCDKQYCISMSLCNSSNSVKCTYS